MTESILVIKILEAIYLQNTQALFFKCSFCAETFESLQSQLHHEKRHEPFRFKCDQCKKSFQFQCELKQHSNIHLPNSKKFKCTSRNCNRRYSSLKALKLHTKVHDEVNYPCDECNKIFNSYQNLSQHKCGIHGDGWVALCGAKFPWPKQMHKHERHCKACCSKYQKTLKKHQ